MARVRLDDDVAEFFATVEPDNAHTFMACVERLQGLGRADSPFAYDGLVAVVDAIDAALSAPDFEGYLAAQREEATC